MHEMPQFKDLQADNFFYATETTYTISASGWTEVDFGFEAKILVSVENKSTTGYLEVALSPISNPNPPQPNYARLEPGGDPLDLPRLTISRIYIRGTSDKFIIKAV